MNVTEDINSRRPILRLILGIAVFALIIFGISSGNFPDLGEFLPLNEPTQVIGEEAVQATPEPSPTPNQPVMSSKNLIIWVPPQFDPTAGNPGSDIFQARLDDFTSRRPQSEIQVRVKHANGEFGMMESLRLVSDAAPIIKPDLVALPRALAEVAFREGYLLPLNEYADQLEDDEWYDYARDLAKIDDQWVGFPFAGDLMVLAFKNDNGDDVPTDWNMMG